MVEHSEDKAVSSVLVESSKMVDDLRGVDWEAANDSSEVDWEDAYAAVVLADLDSTAYSLDIVVNHWVAAMTWKRVNVEVEHD